MLEAAPDGRILAVAPADGALRSRQPRGGHMITGPRPDEAVSDRRSTPEYLPVEELHLDAKNPRIQQVAEDLDERAILEILWREYSVEELAWSIAQNGYFPHESLFVADENGQLVVVEGNRRLAAVRILRDPALREKLRADSIPHISDEAVEQLAKLPVIRRQRDEIWQYIGFKHVNGPQVWSSLAKAEYIAWVRNQIGTDLTQIASTIGDRHSTVARLYRAYMALKQAEDKGVYDREKRTRKHFAFSHLYTGLDYPGIREFTQVAELDTPTEKPIPEPRLKEFGELCVWLWGDKDREQPPLIRSQNPNLRELDETLHSDVGLVALRAGYGLKRSVDVARGDTALFREALLNAKQALQEARAKVVTGFEGEADLRRDIEEIVDLVDALYNDMSQVTVDRRRSRRRPG